MAQGLAASTRPLLRPLRLLGVVVHSDLGRIGPRAESLAGARSWPTPILELAAASKAGELFEGAATAGERLRLGWTVYRKQVVFSRVLLQQLRLQEGPRILGKLPAAQAPFLMGSLQAR